jgi:hypothetical protein
MHEYLVFVSPFLFCVLVVLGFEFRAYTLSHSTSPFLLGFFFEIGSWNYLPWLASNPNPPDLAS